MLRDPADEEEEESAEAFSFAASIMPCLPTFPHKLLYLTFLSGLLLLPFLAGVVVLLITCTLAAEVAEAAEVVCLNENVLLAPLPQLKRLFFQQESF